MKILFLTPWYPSAKDAMSGLFVQKHVEAVRAQGCDVRVIFSQGWRETWRQWKTLQKSGWMPDIVQLNVIQKQGVLALWLKKRYGIPYVIIEHWSGYLPENGSYMRQGALKRRFCGLIASQASVLMPVSNCLKEAMQQCGIRNERWEKVNNVVDEGFFNPTPTLPTREGESTKGTKIILHVSCFDERAKELAFEEGLLRWTGELTPQEVAKEMHKADVFVLSSNYENAPVVLSESLACGTPIIATRAGGMPEMVSDECGVLVPPRDDQALYEAMDFMLDHNSDYNPAVIRKHGEQYSPERVGKHLKAIYESVL